LRRGSIPPPQEIVGSPDGPIESAAASAHEPIDA
jgi:hypothetical protein